MVLILLFAIVRTCTSDRTTSSKTSAYEEDSTIYVADSCATDTSYYEEPADSSVVEYEEDESQYENYQLATGSKPYSSVYGKGRTGENYLDFNTSGNRDYVVIVKRYGGSKVINHIYIRGGEHARLYLPDGEFSVYFYSGKGWNPNKPKGKVTGGFVDYESTQKDEPVSLYDQYCEYTLYPVQNGNLQLAGADDNETFN